MKLPKLPKLKMNVQSYKTKGKFATWKYTGFCGLHIFQPRYQKPGDFLIVLPALDIRKIWVIQDFFTEQEYFSVCFGWIFWSAEFYFRGRKSRPVVEL